MSIEYNPAIVTDGLILCLDAANPKSYSVNVHPYPLDAGAWATSAYGATVSRDTATSPSPAGGIPLKMAITGADPYTATYGNSTKNLAPTVAGETWTVSAWVKASTSVTGNFFIFGADSSGGYIEIGAPSLNITTSWTRVSGSYTMSNPSTAYVQLRFDGPDSGAAGVNIWWDGIQVERSASASTFNSSANINGANFYDVSGNNNNHIIPVPIPYSNGKFTLDGATQGFTRSSALNNVTANCTVVIWYATTDNRDLWVEGQSTSYYLSASETNNYYHSNCGSPTNYIDTVSSINPTTSRDNIYHMWEAKTVDFRTWSSYAWFLYPGTWQMNGSVAAIMVYNRTLTAVESAQNFNAYRGRYNI